MKIMSFYLKKMCWLLFGVSGLIYFTPSTAFSSEMITLEVGTPLNGSFSNNAIEADNLKQKQSSVAIKVSCQKGDYLTGFVSNGNNTLTIDVINSEGNISRRLIDHKSGKHSFYSVAENCDETWRLSGSGSYQIVLENRISLKDQTPDKQDTLSSPKISALNNVLKKGGSTHDFWLAVEKLGTPLVEETSEGTVMTFLARGDYNNVKLIGAPSNNHESLQRLANSDTWYKSFIVPDNTHLSYQIAPDVPQPPLTGFARRVAIKAVAQVDPYNHYPWSSSGFDKFSTKSTITLEGAPKNPMIDSTEIKPKGTFSQFYFTSSTLANTREITIYSPLMTKKNKKDAVLLYIFDAQAYIELVNLPTILDNLMAEGAIPPVITVFISNPDREARARELPANSIFADVLANELIPQIKQRLPIIIPKEKTVIAGSSYGGLAATTIALRHPEIFGNVISMSGSFWWSPKAQTENDKHFVASEVIAMDKKAVRLFLSAGLFENSRGVGDGILETNRHLRDVLLAKGYDVTHQEYSAGHDYFAWRGIIADGLLSLFTSNQQREKQEK
ncbi:alpha/beta hydrolase [Colwellia sp. 20A7]|uniref:alpha/beta hydrolase n=1 Tax=Colwellia sp. 20A7 TaxID=2689569 RepID=UPI001356B28D|nr:alpha/beta hydrolase-fold protein [Colwellia sp. 20A7]